MKNFTDTLACQSRVHCYACRNGSGFRDSIRQHFAVPDDFDQRCPLGLDSTTGTPLPPFPLGQTPDSAEKNSRATEKLAPPEKFIVPQEEPLPPTISSAEAPVPSADGSLTVTVTGFSGNIPPNGTWKIAPGVEGASFGLLFVKVIPADQGWNLEISKKCCGGRLTLFATGKIVELGLPFEVIGSNDFGNQKGTGQAVGKTSD
jgi:hypothetical protein